jgi:putative membrane protein
MLSDGQILDMAYTANQGEVTEAQIALSRASSTAVHDFAQMMIDDHTAAAANVTTVSTSTNIALTTSPVSQELASESAAEATELNAASSIEFDALYMSRQVDDHEAVLHLLDGTIDQADNSEVQSLLVSMRATVQGHLTVARQIRDTL